MVQNILLSFSPVIQLAWNRFYFLFSNIPKYFKKYSIVYRLRHDQNGYTHFFAIFPVHTLLRCVIFSSFHCHRVVELRSYNNMNSCIILIHFLYFTLFSKSYEYCQQSLGDIACAHITYEQFCTQFSIVFVSQLPNCNIIKGENGIDRIIYLNEFFSNIKVHGNVNSISTWTLYMVGE